MPGARPGYLPIMVDVRGRRCVVVGGGTIAQRKISTLLRQGALVTVISPQLTGQLRRCARQGRVRHMARAFRRSDVRGAWLVYAATNDRLANQRVAEAAAAQRIFTNVVDTPSLCSFIMPALLQRGDLVVAVSTRGGSPALAKKVREELATEIGPAYGRMLTLLRSLRSRTAEELTSYQARKRFFAELIEGDVFRLVRAGKGKAAREASLALLQRSSRRNGGH